MNASLRVRTDATTAPVQISRIGLLAGLVPQGTDAHVVGWVEQSETLRPLRTPAMDFAAVSPGSPSQSLWRPLTHPTSCNGTTPDVRYNLNKRHHEWMPKLNTNRRSSVPVFSELRVMNI
jgi:hypothetical protein